MPHVIGVVIGRKWQSIFHIKCFKRGVQASDKNEENDDESHLKHFVEGYLDRPYAMESVTLINAARSWTYNPKRRRDKKWEARTMAAIVKVFPRFTTIPTRQLEKWVDFCWSEFFFVQAISKYTKRYRN